jgi:hypothetical protein
MWYAFVINTSATINLYPIIKESRKFYPFLNWSELESGYQIEDRIDMIAKYINAMDLYVDLTTDKTVPEKELVAA